MEEGNSAGLTAEKPQESAYPYKVISFLFQHRQANEMLANLSKMKGKDVLIYTKILAFTAIFTLLY